MNLFRILYGLGNILCLKGIRPVQLWVDFIAIAWDTLQTFYYLRIRLVNLMGTDRACTLQRKITRVQIHRQCRYKNVLDHA